MAALGSPARTLRGLLRELRYLNAATGRPYRDTAAYRYLVKAFRAHRVTSEKLCRAQHELHFQAATYLCLLRSIRQHVALHQEFHGKGLFMLQKWNTSAGRAICPGMYTCLLTYRFFSTLLQSFPLFIHVLTGLLAGF
uniref:Protein FMC1 homolog n=1 Tax=Mus spicilegus TaxID=10103 RepID=A0A8C6GEZ6_MUSSI